MISKIDPEPQREPEGQGNLRKILIAEDDECQLEILDYRFRQQGFEVLRANSGAEAVVIAAPTFNQGAIFIIEMAVLGEFDHG